MILHGDIEGTGDGDGLVLLHPVGLDHTFWSTLPAALGRGRRVLSLDLRGHRASTATDDRPPVQTYADDVHATMQTFGVAKAIVLGVSFGGMIAQTLALSHPDAVSRLILCACPAGIPPEACAAMRERGLTAERDGMASIVPATLERWFTPGFLGDPVVERVRQRLLANDARQWSAGWHAIAEFNALPQLGMIRAPTLVVAGDIDRATSRAASTALAAAIPGAHLEVLPHAPHMMQLETPQSFAELVGGFIH